jgi:hypothetical protein
MKAHVVHKFSSSKRIRAFHYDMFHGEYEDESESTPMANGGIGEDFTVPVRLVRNGWYIPDVFMPSLTFVVSAQVLDLFLDVKHLAIRPVQFAKLIDVPFFVDDFSFYESPEYLSDPIDAAVLFDRLMFRNITNAQESITS